MSKYNTDLDYAFPGIDISKEELNSIITEADRIIMENSEGHEKLAMAYLKKAQCLQKLEEYEENTETKKDEFNDVASTQEQIKNFIEKALELYPDMPEAIMQMGKIYHRLSKTEKMNKEDNLEKAIDMYTKAIRLKPDYVAAYNNRGRVYDDKKEYDLATIDYSTAIKINPNYPLVFDDLQYAWQCFIGTVKFKPTKCQFCGLPLDLIISFYNNEGLCGKCMYNSQKVEEDFNNFFYNEIYDGYTGGMTRLTIEELRIRAREYVKPEPIIINNIPVHKNQNTELLEGEIFKKYGEKDVEVSNLGRVKYGDYILEQYDPQNNDYLFVDIKNMGKTIPEKVYRLVAETWLESPDFKELPEVKKSELHNTVHHISNNGYDNRIENLMWVTGWEHAMIHPWISIDAFDFEELMLLFDSYRYINITPLDYQRIINITKKMQKLDKSESPEESYFDYQNIIESMEDLIKKNGRDL